MLGQDGQGWLATRSGKRLFHHLGVLAGILVGVDSRGGADGDRIMQFAQSAQRFEASDRFITVATKLKQRLSLQPVLVPGWP